MKQYGFIYTNFNEMQSFIYNNNIHIYNNVFIQIFTGIVKTTFVSKVVNEISSLLPKAEIIGTTTAGEIFHGNTFASTTIICFSIFEKVQIKTTLLNNHSNENELGLSIVKELVKDDTKVVILFSEGLLTNAEKIIKGIHSANSNVVICGGKAADNGYLKKTFVFTKNKITENGVVAASLTGKDLNVTTKYSLCWSSIGKLMTITKAIDNRIFTIDDIKAVDIYKKYLGDEIAKDLPMSATEFPLIIKRGNIEAARVAFRCYDDGSMGFLGNVKVGDKVQFGYGNVNMITSNSLNLINNLQMKSIEGIFIYSCSIRRSFMQNSINLETLPLNSIAPTFGFFTYGEFFTKNHSNKLLNGTMTILGLSECESVHKNNPKSLIINKLPSENFFQGKDLGVIRAFTNLTNQVTKELQETNKLLEYEKHKIEQMKNITNLVMQINNEILYSGKIDNLLQMILDKAIDIINVAKIGSIMFIENNTLIYKAINGYSFNKANEIAYKLEDLYHHKIYNSSILCGPIIVKDLGKHLFSTKGMYVQWKNMFIKTPIELLSCNIIIDDKVMGFINLFNTNKQSKFTNEDKSLIKHLCNEIAIVLKNAELFKDILYLSRYDSLTSLYNRYYFQKILNEILDKAMLSNEIFVVCIVDLNNLKIINDTYGHDAGDMFLVKFSKIFKAEIDDEDIFGRTGGDEFTVIFINKSKAEVIDVIHRIYNMFQKEPLDFNGDKKEISFAYGLSQFPEDSKNVHALLKIADKKMYDNKRMMKK